MPIVDAGIVRRTNMRWRPVIGLSLFIVSLLACSLAGGRPSTPPPVNASPTVAATIPPIVPGTRRATAFPTPPIIRVATPSVPATSTGTLIVTLTATLTATITATVEATRPAPTVPPVSTGPLDFQVSLVGCRRDDSREGGVILTFKVDATGGNGLYTYIREGQSVAQISERPATKGSGVIDAWRVRSGDGQEVQRKYRFAGSELNCP
jgi:hypothetical protein